jgi:hypothetical protein
MAAAQPDLTQFIQQLSVPPNVARQLSSPPGEDKQQKHKILSSDYLPRSGKIKQKPESSEKTGSEGTP